MEALTLTEYAEMAITANGLSRVAPKTKDGLTWFDYEWTNPESGVKYYYFATVPINKTGPTRGRF